MSWLVGWLLLSVGFTFGWVAARWYQSRLRDLGFDDGGEVYRCGRCGGLSADPWDVQRRYCSLCHRFEDGSRLE